MQNTLTAQVSVSMFLDAWANPDKIQSAEWGVRTDHNMWASCCAIHCTATVYDMTLRCHCATCFAPLLSVHGRSVRATSCCMCTCTSVLCTYCTAFVLFSKNRTNQCARRTRNIKFTSTGLSGAVVVQSSCEWTTQIQTLWSNIEAPSSSSFFCFHGTASAGEDISCLCDFWH